MADMTLMGLAEQAANTQGAYQNQKINQMKMQAAEDQIGRQNQIRQSFAGGMPNAQELYKIDPEFASNYENDQLKIQENTRKFVKGAATDLYSRVKDVQDPNQQQAIINQYIEPLKPQLQRMGLPMSEPMTIEHLKMIMGSAGAGEYHPPVATSQGYLQYGGNGFEPMLNPQGQPYMPGAVDVGNKFDIGMAGSLSKLVEQGYMDLPTAQSILKNQVMGQGQGQPQMQQPMQQQPMQQRQAPQVFIDQNMSPEDQAIAQQDYNTYENNVASQNVRNAGIPTAGQREIEKVSIANQGKAFENEEKLANKYQGESKAFRDLSDAYQKTNVLFDKAKDSAPATLAAATAYMKLLDPGSVVRESELGMALNATGKLDKAANYMNRISRGEVLTESQIKLFKEATKDVYKAATKQQRLIDKNYKEVSKRNNLNYKNVIQDVGQYGVYNSAEELKAAVANGDLELEDAKEISRIKFGLE